MRVSYVNFRKKAHLKKIRLRTLEKEGKLFRLVNYSKTWSLRIRRDKLSDWGKLVTLETMVKQ